MSESHEDSATAGDEPKSSFAKYDVFSFSQSFNSKGSGENSAKETVASGGWLAKKHGQIEQSDTCLRGWASVLHRRDGNRPDVVGRQRSGSPLGLRKGQKYPAG
ncbi:hypothetical protein EAI_16096 [Harpegnathos saltator]|uniref:Uncharacterized protein n=1 Tax=Harpegnathos saltator TaxID=610380 RepID=E2B2I7_HARSA|nr:hypothetical protein EAI_16096 [Harpegnathos saltator]